MKMRTRNAPKIWLEMANAMLVVVTYTLYILQQILTKILANSTDDDDDVTAMFSNKVADIIRGDLDANLMNSANSDVDCNESTIHRDMKLQHIISDSYQMKVIDLINNL